jgi:predicted ATP-grasp superfamily ATP-dependent carboligase
VNAVAINDELVRLANNIAEVLPGLSGYVGVDLIDDNENYVIVDINPRLTSSYVGLSNILKSNPAELCIGTFMNQCLPENIIRNDKVVEVCLE